MIKFTRLKQIRKEKKLTRDELASISGVDKGTIQKMEIGYHNDIRVSTLIKLADALNVKVADLLEENLLRKIV